MNINQNDLKLDPDNDSYIVVKFTGLGSAHSTVYPVNVSSMQMIIAGKVVEWQGTIGMNEENLKEAVRSALEEKFPTPKIAKVEPGNIGNLLK